MKQLTIISHTEHYKTTGGTLVGFGATVTEINHLLAVFDAIVHVAVLYDNRPPVSALPYQSDRIRFVALPAVGGQGVNKKMEVVWKAAPILNIIRKALRGSTHFQFRAPTGIGVFVIPYLVFFSSKKGWFKYAGNWKQEQAPLAYCFQRWLLQQQRRKVTINGTWPDQPRHCLSFENPCLTNNELETGRMCRHEKSLIAGQVSLCFVGRLEAAKGFDMFIESLKKLPELYKNTMKRVHFVGHGEFSETHKQNLTKADIPFVFHGTLQRQDVHNIYKACHFIVLPSRSEGFPKVISEALNYGCIPIVSNVSALGQYITDGVEGVLLQSLTQADLQQCLQTCLSMKPKRFKAFVNQPDSFYRQFTYDYYNSRILNEILK